MPFSEKVKLEIKKKALQRCCICHNIGIEIHHIIPQSEKGPNTIENGAPLCPSCHETYGDNPKKRKFIKETRDIWYQICAERYGPNNERFNKLEETLSDIKEILKDKIPFSENAPHSNFLSLGEIIDFYNKQDIKDQNGFDTSFKLVFATSGDSENKIDREFNEFRDAFLKIFGLLTAEGLIAYTHNSYKLNWKNGISEDEIGHFFNGCYINMLLLFMHSELSFEDQKVRVTFNENKTDLIYHKIE